MTVLTEGADVKPIEPEALISAEKIANPISAKFCVILLVYNDLPYCTKAIESVLAQTDKDFELVIVDNGSTDGTQAALEAYRADPRVKVVRQALNQRSDAAQAAAEAADADYVMFLFADDTYHPRRIEVAREAFGQNPGASYVFFNSNFVDEYDHPLEKIPFTQFSGDISSMDRWGHLNHFLTRGNSLHPCGMVIKSDVYRKTGGFPKTMHCIGDMVFFGKLLGEYDGLFLRDRMQYITIWSDGANESHKNHVPTNQIIFERAVLLESFLKAPILDNLEKIFAKRQSSALQLKSRARQLWFMGQHLIRSPEADCQLIGFRTLHQAVMEADEEFELEVLSATGVTMSEYITMQTARSPIDFSKIYDARWPDVFWRLDQMEHGLSESPFSNFVPPSVHKEIGKLLCTLGLKKLGTRFYRRGEERMALRNKFSY